MRCHLRFMCATEPLIVSGGEILYDRAPRLVLDTYNFTVSLERLSHHPMWTLEIYESGLILVPNRKNQLMSGSWNEYKSDSI